MQNRYNIALIPTTKTDQVVNLSKQLAAIAAEYRLGEKSLPHVTLCQFMATESDLDPIWQTVCQSQALRSIQLVFEKFSCISIANSFWISLLPDNIEALNKMHNTVSTLVKNPVKKISDHYDPHMTLINTKEVNHDDAVRKLSATYVPIKDTFIVSLGKSDNSGQLIEVMFR